MPKKPDWMTEHEWEEKLRQADAQLEYAVYHSPPYIDKISRVMAVCIVSGIALGILAIVVIFILRGLGVV